jgi:Skp family chaperone for outer membrane proteins
MTKKKTAILILAIFLTSLLGGCAEAPVPIGLFDHGKVAKEKAVFGEVDALNAEIALLEELLREEKSALLDELREMEREANESLKEEWALGVKEREKQLNNALDDQFRDFLDTKNREMNDFIADLEKGVNGQLDELTEKALSPLITEMQIAELERASDDLKRQADEKIKEKDAQIKQEIDEKLADSRAAAKRNLDEFADNLRDGLRSQRERQLREFAEERLGGDQKKQNDLAQRRDILLNNVNGRISKAIEAVAKEKDLPVVLSAAVTNVNAIDITDDVIAALLKQ